MHIFTATKMTIVMIILAMSFAGCVEKAASVQAQEASNSLRVILKLPQEAVQHLAWSPDGRYVAAASGGAKGYAIWDAQTGKRLRELFAPYGPSTGEGSVAFTPDSRNLIVVPRGQLMKDGKRIALALWNVETGVIDRMIDAPFDGPPPAYSAARRFSVSVLAQRLAVLYDGRNAPRRVFIYDTRTWQVTNTGVEVRKGPYAPSAFAFDPTGRFVAMGDAHPGDYRGNPRGVLWIHEVATGRLVRTIDGAHATNLLHLKFSGDGNQIASTIGTPTGGQKNVLTGQIDDIHAPDDVRVWSVETGEKIASFLGNYSGAYDLDYNSKIPLVVSGNGSRAPYSSIFRVWDVRSGQVLATLGTFSRGGAQAAAFSFDGRRLAMAGRRDGDLEGVFIVDVVDLDLN